MSYSLTQLLQQFPDADACLQYLFEKKYEQMRCPKCRKTGNFRRNKGLPCYACTCGKYQIYPRKGTIFENSKTPLPIWFQIIYLTTCGTFNAKDIEKMTGISYPTAWKIQKTLMQVMARNIKHTHHLSQWKQKVRTLYRAVTPENLPLYEACLQYKSENEKSDEGSFFRLLHLLMNYDGA